MRWMRLGGLVVLLMLALWAGWASGTAWARTASEGGGGSGTLQCHTVSWFSARQPPVFCNHLPANAVNIESHTSSRSTWGVCTYQLLEQKTVCTVVSNPVPPSGFPDGSSGSRGSGGSGGQSTAPPACRQPLQFQRVACTATCHLGVWEQLQCGQVHLVNGHPTYVSYAAGCTAGCASPTSSRPPSCTAPAPTTHTACGAWTVTGCAGVGQALLTQSCTTTTTTFACPGPTATSQTASRTRTATAPTAACQPVYTACVTDDPGWVWQCLTNPTGGAPVACQKVYNPQECPVPEGY